MICPQPQKQSVTSLPHQLGLKEDRRLLVYILPVEYHKRHRDLHNKRQILLCIEQGTHQIRDMVPLMYKDTPEFMYPAAARSVLAAIENLVQKEQVREEGEGPAMDKAYHLA